MVTGSGAANVKMFESWRSAHICLSPNVLNGEAGTRLLSASASSLAASAALSEEELCGISMSCGNNFTARAMRSALVFVIYIV